MAKTPGVALRTKGSGVRIPSSTPQRERHSRQWMSFFFVLELKGIRRPDPLGKGNRTRALPAEDAARVQGCAAVEKRDAAASSLRAPQTGRIPFISAFTLDAFTFCA